MAANSFLRVIRRVGGGLALLCLLGTGRGEEAPIYTPKFLSLAEMRLAVAGSGRANASYRLEGIVCGVSSDGRLVALQDESDTLLLDCPSLPKGISPGKRILLEGDQCPLARGRYAIHLGTAPLIEIEGHHAELARANTIYLRKGEQPLRVDWFNGLNLSGLSLEYEGPGIPMQKVPAGVLFHDGKDGKLEPGLRYESYLRDRWIEVGEIDTTEPASEGVSPVIDIGVAPRTSNVGLSFTGRIRIETAGIYNFRMSSDDGSRLFVGDPRFSASIIPDEFANPPRPDDWRGASSTTRGSWVEGEGNVTFATLSRGLLELELAGEDSSFRVTVMDPGKLKPDDLEHRRVKLLGVGRSEGVIVPDSSQLQITGDSIGHEELLTRAGQVRRLKPEEAKKAYRARIRGVVTMAGEHFLVIQDSTGGIYVRYTPSPSGVAPRAGELWELEGVTDPGDFSPMLYADRASYLGSAPMPEAVRPTWEQIASGSLDAEWVELEGVVVSLQATHLILLTRDGQVRINDNTVYSLPYREMSEAERQALPGSVVRLRGVFTANWDSNSRVNAGVCQMGNAIMAVDSPAPADPFATDSLPAADLLLFTSHTGLFKRVRTSGTLLHARPPEFFLWDGSRGFRVVSRDSPVLIPGEKVEAAGFPRVGGPSPMLLEAYLRRAGLAPLPAPVKVAAEALPNPRLDATRVTIEARLLSDSMREEERVLEMQAGETRFIARVAATTDRERKPFQRGSLLQLAGTYVTSAADSPGSAAEPFELLLNGAQDLVVLQRGPWWTRRHTIATIAILAGGLCMALIWVLLLRRTVNLRTRQLEAEIGERQLVERHRALEQERTRVAQDLHDELGSGLTEAGILTSLVKNPAVPSEKKEGYLEQLGDVCSALVTGLDEIVWAVNPRYDSVADLAGYFSLFAQRFLEIAGITCRLQIADSVAEHPLGSHQRHDIFLAFKEALNNIVRHSGAREVRLIIEVAGGDLQVLLADDGKGFAPGAAAPGSDGLTGMKQRMEKLGGACRISSTPGRGTTVGFSLPLERSHA
ncbi:histidine kinase [Luteolibacter sp. GHJ8]|uniref:Histidine kinase n=1 Tax=Luteolibacter rhizosphaerae TaxID=2989719 RepID=A0ABT3FWN2_9BACT|nr:ATP-binding protein [Luteolibacter rhizosphaerae]MCW1911967.1 histidine kinase [Luteolibacter rhizosphaerae]